MLDSLLSIIDRPEAFVCGSRLVVIPVARCNGQRTTDNGLLLSDLATALIPAIAHAPQLKAPLGDFARRWRRRVGPRAHAALDQRLAHRPANHSHHLGCVAKLNLALGWVDVDVD